MSELLDDFQRSVAPYDGLQPNELTPEIVTELFSVTFQFLGRLMVNGQPKRGRPPKPKPAPVTVVDDHIELQGRKLTPDEARALGAMLFDAAEQLQPEEFVFDEAQKDGDGAAE